MADRVQEFVLEGVPSAADIAGLFEALTPPISAKTAAAIDDPTPTPLEESVLGPPLQKDAELDVEFTEHGHQDRPVDVDGSDTDPAPGLPPNFRDGTRANLSDDSGI